MPADLVRRKVEQGPVLVCNVLVLVSQIYLRTIVASHLSHSIVALHWKTTERGHLYSFPFYLRPGQLTRISNARRVRLCWLARLPYRFFWASTSSSRTSLEYSRFFMTWKKLPFSYYCLRTDIASIWEPWDTRARVIIKKKPVPPSFAPPIVEAKQIYSDNENRKRKEKNAVQQAQFSKQSTNL